MEFKVKLFIASTNTYHRRNHKPRYSLHTNKKLSNIIKYKWKTLLGVQCPTPRCTTNQEALEDAGHALNVITQANPTTN